MSEKLDPEEVHQIMDGCFKILMDEIHKYEGTINQFTGDGIMALFGAPVAHEDHAQRACYAALSVQNKLDEYGEKIKKDTRFEFKMRIGLNSGHVIVGSIGDDLRMDYSALGDTTNLAARMEQAAKPGSILISEQTHKIVESYFQVNPLGKLSVKGKEEPQEAYELVKASEVTTRIEASAAKGLTRFVGRKNSMASLMEAWEKAKSGSGQVVGIVGEAGVGKSRLLLEFRNKVAQGNCYFLQGQCLHYGSNMPYLPVLDIIKAYFDITEDDREYIIRKKIREGLDESLADTIAPFQELLSLKSDDESFSNLEAKQKRDRTFEAIRDLLLRLSEDQPVILVIEDLHWIDNTSQEFLDYMIGWIAAKPVLLVLLYRPEYTHQWGSKSFYNRIGLDHLGPESSTDLVRAMLEGGEIASELRELILERAAGNPLFMEEFTHSLQENGSIQLKDDRYVLSRSISELDVPETVQGIIAARMDRLEDNLKRTMQVASVIGRDFAFRILQTITGMREELKSYLLNLQGLEFIYEKNLFPELEYIFKHALIRDVAYSSLLQKRRQEIHENIGQAIESIYAERIEDFYEMLAYHYSESNNFENAYQYLMSAGEKAVRNYSNEEALGFYKQAIQLIKRQPESDENKRKIIEVIRLMTIPMLYSGYPDYSLQMLQLGESLSLEFNDEKEISFFYSKIAHFYTYKGESELADEYREKSYLQAEKNEDLDSMVEYSSSILTVYLSRGMAYKLMEISSKVINLLEKNDRQKESFGAPFIPYSYCCAEYGLASGYVGKFDQAEVYFEKGLEVANEVNDLIAIGLTECLYGLYYIFKGDGKKIIEYCQRSIHSFEEAKALILYGFAWSGLGIGYYFIGDLDTARNHAQKGLEIQKQSGISFFLALPYLFSSMIEYDYGNHADAQSLAEKALTLARDQGEKHFEALSACWLGVILSGINPEKCNQAEELVLRGIEIVRELDLKSFLAIGYSYLGECYWNSGKKDRALENLKTAEKLFRELGGNEFYQNRGKEIRA